MNSKTRTSARRITVIIKTTWACNMRCVYCYEQSNGYNSAKVQLSTIYNLLAKIKEYFGDGAQVKLIWHGGEPLLLGKEFYQQVMNMLTAFPALQVQNSLQTNGTLLDKEWLEFFDKYRFRVGVSLDGPKVLHDKQRVFVNGRGSFQKVWESYQMLRKYQPDAGAVAVVTSLTLQFVEEFYDFYKENRISVKLSPLIPPKGEFMKKERGISPKEYGKFLVHIFHKWISEPEFLFSIDPLFGIVRSFITGRPQSCVFSGECEHFLAIEPHGAVTICGRWSASEMYLGNINRDSLYKIYQSMANNFIKQRSLVSAKCADCKYFPVCHGGCSYLSFSKRGHLDDKDFYCEAYQALFREVEHFLSEEGVPTIFSNTKELR